MKTAQLLRKAIEDKFVEWREYFFGAKMPDKVAVTALKRLSAADVELHRLEMLASQANPADPEHSFIFLQRDRADRKFRARQATLEKLTRNVSANRAITQHWGIRSRFGFYEIHGKEFVHWKYILSKPYEFGFHRKEPKDALKINGEFFLSLDQVKEIKDKHRRSHQTDEQIRRGYQMATQYQVLPRAEFLPLFMNLKPEKERIKFNDQILRADARTEKRLRNRVDYQNSKKSKTRQEIKNA